MKGAWRNLLRVEQGKDPSVKVLNKTVFPSMLKKLVTELDAGRLLGPAFAKCGLFPISVEKATERIPSVECPSNAGANFDQELISTLSVRRFGDGQRKKTRGTKIAPGKSWSREELSESETELSESENIDDIEGSAGGEIDESGCDNDDLPDPHPQSDVEEYPVGAFVAAIYEDDWYIAQVEGEDSDEETDGFVLLKYMKPTSQKNENSFVWPERADLLKTNIDDIIAKVDPPIPRLSSRAFGLCDKDFDIVKNKLVKWFLFIYFFIFNFLTSSMSFEK